MRADFHLHTHKSDGVLSPAELLAAVRAAQLDYWSVTDHDTLSVARLFQQEAGLIPGVEVTASFGGREIHVVGLGVNLAHDGLEAMLAASRQRRRERMAILIQRLPAKNRSGLDVSTVDDGMTDSVGRLHLARLLVERGAVRRVNDAFQRWLGDDYAVDNELPAFPVVSEVITHLHAAGGVALLAHPGIYSELPFIETLLDQGLDGLEIDHPGLGADRRASFMDLAHRRRLLMSSGSDLHFLGARRPGMCSLSDNEWRPLQERLGIN